MGLVQVIDAVAVDQVLPFLNERDAQTASKAVLTPKPCTYTVERRGDFYYIHGDMEVFMAKHAKIWPFMDVGSHIFEGHHPMCG